MSDDVGEQLLETWGGDDPADALCRAQQAPTTTPDDELPRCPECQSVRLRARPGTPHQQPEKRDTDYWCENCHTAVDDPEAGR